MALVMLCGLLTGCGRSKETENMKIYYINALGDGIGAVGYHMDATKTDAMIDEALQALATRIPEQCRLSQRTILRQYQDHRARVVWIMDCSVCILTGNYEDIDRL